MLWILSAVLRVFAPATTVVGIPLLTLCELDKQGRILVPGSLREFAKIDKEVIFAGLLTRIELWSKERYEEINNYDNMDEIAEQLGINLNFSI